jgi:hypothetical protein
MNERIPPDFSVRTRLQIQEEEFTATAGSPVM